MIPIQLFEIEGIPSILYGSPCSQVYLYVHGKCGRKEEAEAFAALACPRGWQVLGVDLPGHGERTAEAAHFNPFHAVLELRCVMRFLESCWKRIALYANSIGAWFSMLAFEEKALDNCLFVSPVVEMDRLIRHMMERAGVTEDELQRKGQIKTEEGDLDWHYAQYARKHSELLWRSHTSVLYAEKDALTERGDVDAFVKRNRCLLTVMPEGKHWFHTPEQLAMRDRWIIENGFPDISGQGMIRQTPR